MEESEVIRGKVITNKQTNNYEKGKSNSIETVETIQTIKEILNSNIKHNNRENLLCWNSFQTKSKRTNIPKINNNSKKYFKMKEIK